MQKRKLEKKLVINKETLHRLEPGELQKAPGGAILSWDSDCFWGTCGRNSCAELGGLCSLARCPVQVQPIGPVDGGQL